jgi:hypothetical protein
LGISTHSPRLTQVSLAVISPQFSHRSCDPPPPRGCERERERERDPQSATIAREGCPIAKGGGERGTDLEVVGEVGVVAALARPQVGDAVQLRAHVQRVEHHRHPLAWSPRVRASSAPRFAADVDEEGGGSGVCFATSCGFWPAGEWNGRDGTGIRCRRAGTPLPSVKRWARMPFRLKRGPHRTTEG